MNSNEFFNKTRTEYVKGELREDAALPDPVQQFTKWFNEAMEGREVEPNACALATVGNDLQPSVRMVLLKSFDARGFVFFTNYESAKGRQLAHNKKASLLFYWPSQERQVRLEGEVEKISAAESDAYFKSRPRDSQCGSACSQQSRVASSREEIDAALQLLMDQAGDGGIERPAHWGGYRLAPTMFEFWQGRENRLHDRLIYRCRGESWKIERLWP